MYKARPVQVYEPSIKELKQVFAVWHVGFIGGLRTTYEELKLITHTSFDVEPERCWGEGKSSFFVSCFDSTSV